jgi:hypothetical protein
MLPKHLSHLSLEYGDLVLRLQETGLNFYLLKFFDGTRNSLSFNLSVDLGSTFQT